MQASPRRLLAAATIGLIAASACGGSHATGSDPASKSARTRPSGARVAAQLRRLVLRPPASYRAVPAQMHPISLGQETSNDSPRAAKIERATYLGGYQAGYTKQGVRLLVTVALEYTSTSAPHRVDTDLGTLRIAAAQMNGRLIPAPPGAPGADPILIEGALPSHGRLLPVTYYVWREGRFVFAVFMEGRNASLPAVLRLAAAQDAQDGRLPL